MKLDLAQVEALLFAAAKPLSKAAISDIGEISVEEVDFLVLQLQQNLEEMGRGIRVRISGAGIELVTAPEASELIVKIRRKEDNLTNAAMETLAVVAFKQPVTKAEIEEVRGVSCERILKQLLSRQLITELGQKDTIGRPIIYGTTEEFLRSIGASSIEELRNEVNYETYDDTSEEIER